MEAFEHKLALQEQLSNKNSGYKEGDTQREMYGLNNSPNKNSQNFQKSENFKKKSDRNWDPIELDVPTRFKRRQKHPLDNSNHSSNKFENEKNENFSENENEENLETGRLLRTNYYPNIIKFSPAKSRVS